MRTILLPPIIAILLAVAAVGPRNLVAAGPGLARRVARRVVGLA